MIFYEIITTIGKKKKRKKNATSIHRILRYEYELFYILILKTVLMVMVCVLL